MWLYFPASHSAPEAQASRKDSPSHCQLSQFSQYCTWRGKHSPPRTWLVRWQGEPWLAPLSTATYETYQQECSANYARWIRSSLPQDFPASHSQQPAREEGAATPGGSGQTSMPSSKPSRHMWSCLRTSEGSSTTGYKTFSRPLPSWGSMQNGAVTPQPKPAHHTNESACSYSAWPTACASDSKSSAGDTTTTGTHLGVSLADAALRRWPTPTATQYGSSQNGTNGKHGKNQRPSANTPGLEQQAKTLSERFHHLHTTLTPGCTCSRQAGGTSCQHCRLQLNPRFVAWLMGQRPDEPTSYDSTATASYHNK